MAIAIRFFDSAARGRSALPGPLLGALALLLVAGSSLAAQALDPKLDESIQLYTGVAGHVDNARAAELLLDRLRRRAGRGHRP
jgi:hypothetical protein